MFFSGVSPSKEEALYVRMKALGGFEKDVIEKFIRSSGKGWQHKKNGKRPAYFQPHFFAKCIF